MVAECQWILTIQWVIFTRIFVCKPNKRPNNLIVPLFVCSSTHLSIIRQQFLSICYNLCRLKIRHSSNLDKPGPLCIGFDHPLISEIELGI